MRKFLWSAAILVTFLAGVAWGGGASLWKTVGKVPESDGNIKVMCDAERGNLVYLAPVDWGKKNYMLFVIHQPETCFPTPAPSPPSK